MNHKQANNPSPLTTQIAIVVTGWVTKELYMVAKGMTDGQIRGNIQRGIWTKDIHYAVKGRCTWLNVEAIEQWITGEDTQGESDQATTEGLRSAGNSKVRPIRNTSTSSPHRHI